MRFLILIFSLLFISSCNNSGKVTPVIKDGVMDLHNWDFEKNGIVNLDGDWEFYWHKLYTPSDFKNIDPPTTTVFTKVPGVWNNVLIDSNEITGQGFATYRLNIKFKKSENVLGIKLLDAASAYKLWINDSLIFSNGIVSSNPALMKPQMLPTIKYFFAANGTAEIIIQVSNNFHHKGGIWESISIGTFDQIVQFREKKIALTIFLSGVLFILFIYHLWIYFLRRSEKATLWFGILCLTIFIRTLLINERLFYLIFPHFNLNIGYRIEYLSIFLLPIFFSLYNYYLFNKQKSKIAIRIISLITFIEVVLILFTPSSFFTSIVQVFQLIMYFEFIYFFIQAFPQLKSQRKIASLLIFSWLIILICGINDVLYLNLIINTMEVSHFAFFIFIITQAYVISYKISEAFRTIENLSSELYTSNVNLENKVEERTKALKETQAQLVHHEKLASLVQITAGIAHEIKNPLNFVNNFSSISKELLRELSLAKTIEEKSEVTGLLEKNLDKIEYHGKRADTIIKNMLEHSRTSDIQKRLTDINQLCEEFSSYGFHAMRASNPGFKCELNYSFAENIPQVNIVPQEISRVLLNILNNAFYELQKKSKETSSFNPEIIIQTELIGEFVAVRIQDNGNGIPDLIKNKIFEPFFTTKPPGNGTGLGLSMSYDIVKSHGGEITVQSELNTSTVFTFLLPIN